MQPAESGGNRCQPALRMARLAFVAAVLLAPGMAGTRVLAQAAPPPTGGAASTAEAAPVPEPPPPVYEEQLQRLAEILGSLHFLRGLCGDGDSAAWRTEMERLLAAESPPPMRRARLIARFNHGLESFNAVYRSCTPSARRSIARYLAEGRALSEDVQARYSQ